MSAVRSLVVFVLAVGVILNPYAADAGKKSARRAPGCKSVILVNSTKGARLYEKNAGSKILPASTVKVMTALLVMERLPLEQYVTVGARATDVQPSKLDLRPGERSKVKDRLYATLLNSANDASVVLAEAVAGSEEKFVGLMNRRAGQLGANDTKFANSHGLPSGKRGQYTTASDMSLIFRRALKYSFFRAAIQHRYKTIYSQDGRRIDLKSHNKMLFAGWKKNIYGKTGYTRKAGACFVGTVNDGGETFIIGVFNCTDRWEYIKRIVSSYGGIPL
ncbi:MAG: D-alanyl-D-alanine carboxypeptidase [Candidatus Omnitrophica bacterium]|nr:D-alanyl-D-alanine carboxypeptidase [Candidatus Omnitrophota bacterium]